MQRSNLLLRIWRAMAAMLTMLVVATFNSCSSDDGEPTFADPTIEIISPEDLTNLQVLVASPITFTIAVTAEAELSSVSLDGTSIKTYSQGETEDTFDYEYIPTENGIVNLTFVVEDARGTTTDSESVALEGVGDPGFLLADFAGDAGSSVTLSSIDPDHWDADRTITNFDVNGNLTSAATFENVNNQFTVTTGSDNPDASAELIYQGKTMRVEKNPAGWGTSGWSHIMVDFGTTVDQDIIEALPRMNEEQNGLTSGTKYVEIDVYYQDSEALPLSDMIGDDVTVGDNPAWGSDKSQGYSFFLMLTRHEDHRLNPDGSGMYIGYRKYITEANKWITLRFDEFYLENAGNNFGSGNENAAGPGEIDGAKIIAGGGYGDGQSANAIYFRNLRIVDED